MGCRGVAQNCSEFARWIRKAADQGHVDAQYIYGVMFEYGRGVAQSDAESARWYRKAANHENCPS